MARHKVRVRGLGQYRAILRGDLPCRLFGAGAHAARPRHSCGLRPAQERDREAVGARADGVARHGDDGVKVSAAVDATAHATAPPDAPVRPATAPLPVARLIRPQSIAIVGISPEPGSHGAAMFKSLASFDYGGAIHLVSRNRREAFGRPCATAIDDLPMGIDLAVLCVPRVAVMDAVAACGRRGIGGAIVYASGFAETGEAGLAEQNALADLARRAGIALLGPNCLGYINHVDGVALCLPLPEPRRDKNPRVGFLAQSGAMMLAAC